MTNPPYVSFALVDGGTVAIQLGLTPAVRSDQANPLYCYAQTITADTNDTWHIADTADNVANALAAASGGGGGGGGSLRAQAVVDPSGGFLFGGAGLVPTVPHVPGSGDYAFNVGGSPAAFVVQATLGDDPPNDANIHAFMAGPNIILIKIRKAGGMASIDLPFNLSVFAI